MKIGRLKDGRVYAAKCNPVSKKVEIVDTDTDLGKLLERQGYNFAPDDEEENPNQQSTNSSQSYQ